MSYTVQSLTETGVETLNVNLSDFHTTLINIDTALFKVIEKYWSIAMKINTQVLLSKY